MASHSRPLANILCKGTKKGAPKKDMGDKGMMKKDMMQSSMMKKSMGNKKSK
mgnify:FL=1